MKEKKKYEMHVISNTHWDREWRYSFQQTRMMLVDVLDSLMDIMDKDPEYRYYHLDSQTVVLEDYLEIRPQNEERLKKFIKKGRILIGPWYTLPDEFLVSGESLVRNLLIGHLLGERFGGVMKVGYNPFSWGQISQLPQIYKGFGIDTVMFYRGINKDDAPKSEFIWESPDGTQILGSRFTQFPRYNFWYLIYRPVIHGLEPLEREYQWRKKGLIFHMCDETSHTTDYHLLDPVEQFFSEKILTCVQKLKEENVKDFTTPYLLWMQGHDSSAPNPLIPRIIKEANKLLKEDRLIHSSLPAYIEKLKGAVKELKVLKGEMRSSNKDGSSTVLLGDILSARMHLKQINARVENKLQKWAEPFAAFAWILGKEYPNLYLEKAWKYLLANHAHDSIGGCSTDKVQEDMVYRFRQSEKISENLLLRSFQHIVRLINNSDLGEEDISLIVFNCLPFERTEVVSAVLDFPQDFAMKFFFMFDHEGNEIPLQITSKEKTQPILHQLLDSASHLDVERVKCHFLAQSIPPLGYKTFLIKSHKEGIKRNFGSLVLASNTMENEYLWVKINSDGTLKIKDKSTGKVFDNLGFFEDSGEIGNSWQRIPPMCDRIITSLEGNTSIALVEDGPLVATFRIGIKMSLPESVTSNEIRRSNREKEYLITSLVTLRKGAKRVDIITKLNNNVKNHRLRIMFPTWIKAQFACAEGQFDVLQRPIKHPDTRGWVESSMKTHPQLSFVDVSDGEIGLAIINEGLREYEVLDDPFRTIALTFLRCFPFKIWINSEMAIHPEGKGSQCLGNHKFRYALYPHRGDWKDGDVFRQAYQHNAPFTIGTFVPIVKIIDSSIFKGTAS